MIEELQLRITENKDWATVLFILAFALIAITKSMYENRFSEFSKLIFSDKYAKIYRDSSNLQNFFTVALFLVQVISFSFFILLTLNIFGYASKTDWMLFIQIFTFLFFFIVSKYLIEKIIATSFNIDEFIEQFNLQKITYRTYIGILLLPVNAILFYYNGFTTMVPLVILAIGGTISVIAYVLAIKNYQNVIIGKLFYFILYLCALEIAPYYFMYYLFTKGNI